MLLIPRAKFTRCLRERSKRSIFPDQHSNQSCRCCASAMRRFSAGRDSREPENAMIRVFPEIFPAAPCGILAHLAKLPFRILAVQRRDAGIERGSYICFPHERNAELPFIEIYRASRMLVREGSRLLLNRRLHRQARFVVHWRPRGSCPSLSLIVAMLT